MLRKTMIALCAVASVGMLAPEMALAGGGHGGGGGFSGGGGGHAGFSGGGFSSGGAHAAVGGGNFGGRSFASAPTNSFARAAPNASVGAVQGNQFASSNRFASGNFGREFDRGGRGFRHHHGRFIGDGFVAFGPDFGYDYWDYPDYAYDTYYDNGCYVVNRRVHTAYGWRIRPVQVCG